eukprot:TRINITY_DN5794_c0_g3_i4.p1 TRINITY_DN5794_c0_g3~~TRINITY_DN5794_c0_g3_i4.p1  ORF type:complete len:332 (-),score=91.92 TRINITY_DN5794_c0_g3_i4:60-1055(-)
MLRQIFSYFDKDGDGKITGRELRALIIGLGIEEEGILPSEVRVQEWLKEFDIDKSGVLSEGEFVAGIQRWMKTVMGEKSSLQVERLESVVAASSPDFWAAKSQSARKVLDLLLEEGEGEEGGKAEEGMGASSGLEMEEGGEVEGEDKEEEEGDKEVLHLRTMNHGSFRFYAHQFYPQQKNVIPRLVHRWLAPRSLAFWYMYGGYRCPSTGGVVLKAHSYGTKEVTLVTNALKKRQMSAERKLTKAGNIIRIEGKSATWFWRLVYPHILPELHELLEPASAPLDSNGVGFTFRDDPDRNRYKLKKMRALEAEAKRREDAASERPFSQRSSAW